MSKLMRELKVTEITVGVTESLQRFVDDCAKLGLKLKLQEGYERGEVHIEFEGRFKDEQFPCCWWIDLPCPTIKVNDTLD